MRVHVFYRPLYFLSKNSHIKGKFHYIPLIFPNLYHHLQQRNGLLVQFIFSGEYFNIFVYYFIYDAYIYVRISCFIRLLFQDDNFHQIQQTDNFSSIKTQNSMLDYLFMLHCIAEIQCNIQQQPTSNVRYFKHSMLAEKTFPKFML